MYWTVRIRKSSPKDRQIVCTIDRPFPATIEAERDAFIQVEGWCYSRAPGEQPRVIVNAAGREIAVQKKNRPDVVQAHPEASVDCGFQCFVPIGQSFRVGVMKSGAVEWVAEGDATVVNAIVGKNDVLFLDNDHNDSVAQFRGRNRISPDQMSLWGAYFDQIADVRSRLGFKNVFLLVPGKEYVFPDYHQFMREGVSPADQLVARFGDDPAFVYPIDELVRERGLAFPKTDSHWTDYGAGIAAKTVCDSLGVTFVDPKFRYEAIEKAGDLGRKFEPWRSETILRADISPALKRKVFDNEVNNRGWIRIFANEEGAGSCLIFGDSFSQRMVDYLTATFRRVVHVFSAADIDWSIVEAEKPDFLVSEITTRFTLKAPAYNFSILSELERKASASDERERRRVLNAASVGSRQENGAYLKLTVKAFDPLAEREAYS